MEFLLSQMHSPIKAMSTTPSFTTETKILMDKSNSFIEIIATVVSMATLLIVLITTVVVLFWGYNRRSAKQKLHYDDTSYSTLNRGSRQTQVQTTQQKFRTAELYDQIHMSPSTGQTEFIPKPQTENRNNPPYNSHPIHPDTENSVINAIVAASAASHINSPTATYAIIDNSNKKKAKKDDTKPTTAEKCTQMVSSSKGAHAEGKDNSMKRGQKSLDDMYAPDHQDQEEVSSEQESNPSHSVEELYTAVKKKPKGSCSSAPVNESDPQIAEDWYSAVMKKPKENDEAVPPIPPHTVEELYTAVHKKPVGNTMENEEEAPPIPPHTVDDT
jgi:hypothetical protein